SPDTHTLCSGEQPCLSAHPARAAWRCRTPARPSDPRRSPDGKGSVTLRCCSFANGVRGRAGMETSEGTGDLPAGGADRRASMEPGDGGATGGMANLWDGVNFIVDGKPSAPGAEGGFDLDLATAEGLYREAVSLAEDL